MIRSSRFAVALVAAACATSSTSTPAPPAPAPAPAAPAATPPAAPVAHVAPTSMPPAPVAAVDPAGSYELQLAFGGTSLPVALELYKENGEWTGSAGNPNIGTAYVTGVAIDGRKFRVSLSADNGATYTLSLELKADQTVTGNWSGAGDGSNVSGKKIK